MKTLRIVLGLTCMFNAVLAVAGTQATGTNTVSPTMQISATVLSAIRLTLATGTTTAAAHCAVSAGGGDYQMSFGSVDALGISAGNCNLIAPTTPGTSAAIYWSDYSLTPIFTGQSTTNNTITAKVTTNFASTSAIAVVRDSANSATVPSAATDFTPVSTGTPDTIATNAVSGTAINRFIGVQVSPVNSVAIGAQTATVTFTLTVQ